MTSSSTRYLNADPQIAIGSSVGRRRAGTTLIVLTGVGLMVSALTKFLGVPAVVSQLEGFGFTGEIVPLGVLETATALLFLVPRTRFAGLLMFSAFLGGAVATHIQHRVLPIPPAIVLALGWLGVWLRYGIAPGNIGGAIDAMSSNGASFSDARQVGFERISTRVSQIILGLAALLFFAIGAKYVFDPEGAAAASGISLKSGFGVTNMRAGVGGFSLGFGIAAAISVAFVKRTTMGLWLVMVVGGIVLLVRLAGATSDGSLMESRLVLIAETVLVALTAGALALNRAGRRRARGA